MKTMKYLAALLLLLVAATCHADELTAEQLRFRNSIEHFLKEEGFMPTIDTEDNSLNFKKEGVLYWINVSGSSPLYIELHRAGLGCDDADIALVLKACNAGNYKIPAAKAMYNGKNISFAVELYCHSSEEFKYIFFKSMAQLENIKKEVSDYYNNQPSK